MIHTGDISGKIEEAKNTLFLADEYMSALGKEFENLRGIRLSEKQVMDYIEILLPVEENFTPQQKRGIERLREDMRMRYFDAPDLKDVGNNGYRFINAVSDFATHSTPRRKTANYRENIFARTADGNPLIDKAYQMVLTAEGGTDEKIRFGRDYHCFMLADPGGADIPGSAYFIYKGCNNRNLRTEEWLKSL